MKEPLLFYSIVFFMIIMSAVFLINIDVIASQKNQTIEDFSLFFPQHEKPEILEFANAQVILSSNGSVSPQQEM